ncbi:STAS domain-containing protein [Rhodococcus sp. H29-C3]|uniref:STAS domain-containing protein n=1 Tax=Rhodococcus sp. H29-C3 TaxID=3046307 RepID=UPI0024BA76C8|nr:STAS domain-containing protein [Rhodococcus sp. H29-C3]MDJ0360519.1 STAS domain-containing protein [Rhodococcus sp. H29-C3]
MPVDETQAAQFDIAIHLDRSTLVLTVSGDLDMRTAPALDSAISKGALTAPAALVVDLAKVTFVASAAMTVLTVAQNKFGDTLQFAVVADGPATSRPIRLMGLDQVFSLYEDLPTALAALDSPS